MKHIDRLVIDSFRGINNLELNDLSSINILTGDNNCGKTSILEIIRSFAQPDALNTWQSLVRRDLRSSFHAGMSLYEGFCDLFDINAEEKNISYTIYKEGMKEQLCVRGKISEEEMPEEEYAEKIGIYYERETRNEQISTIVSKLEVAVYLNDVCILTNEIYDGQNTFRGYLKGRDKQYTKNITYISPVRHAEGSLYLSEVLDNPDLYEEMLMILKDYDEDILSINYDSDGQRVGRGTYKVLSKAHQKALPLNVYGDGMKKAVLMMSAVIRAKNGILLLDEFETAIHTSAMNKTFKWILETCKKLNVQVFMTSHSKEAIDKILKCTPELLDEITIYTMYKNADNIFVRRLNGKKAIEVQDEMGLELR